MSVKSAPRGRLKKGEVKWAILFSAPAMIPMIVIFLIAQKHIMDGMVQGAIK